MSNLQSMILSATLAAVAFGGAAFAGESPLVISADDDSLEWGPCPAFMPEGCEIAVLNGDPAAANADIFFRVPGGAEIPLHRHASAERMVLVAGELDVTYDGQETATIRVGDYAYGPAGLPHSATCAPGDACVLFIAFVEPVDAVPVGDGGD